MGLLCVRNCVSASVCASNVSTLTPFCFFVCLLVLSSSGLIVCFTIFYYYSLCIFCPLQRDRKGVDSDGRRGREDLGRVEGGGNQSQNILYEKKLQQKKNKGETLKNHGGSSKLYMYFHVCMLYVSYIRL